MSGDEFVDQSAGGRRPGNDVDVAELVRDVRRAGRRTRARRTAAATALIGTLAIGVSAVAIAAGDVADPAAGAVRIEVASESPAVTFAGDTLFGDAASTAIDDHGPAWLGARLEPVDRDDVFIVNLEGPITSSQVPADPTQRWSYNALPGTSVGLAELGVDAVILANNHAFDRGAQGLFDTIAHTADAGIAAFGGGVNRDQARLPLFVDSPAGTVAIVAFEDSTGDTIATIDQPGVRSATVTNFTRDHELAVDAGADVVIATIHWGRNYAPVDDRQRVLAQAMVDAGYDLVVGHGPHVVQPMELVDGVPVFYSLGNWIFGTPGRFKPGAPGQGLIVRVVVEPGDPGSMSFELRCIETDNKVIDFQPRPCSLETTAEVLVGVSPLIVVDGGVGRL